MERVKALLQMIDCGSDEEEYPYWIPSDYVSRKIAGRHADVVEFLGNRQRCVRTSESTATAGTNEDGTDGTNSGYGNTATQPPFVRNPASVSRFKISST